MGVLDRVQAWQMRRSTITKAVAPAGLPRGATVRDLSMDAARMQADFNATTGGQTVQFGPGVPMAPQPLDQSGEPRGYSYRTGWNLPSQPGEGRPLDMQTLRALADTYDILRKAIEVRKDEITGLRFDVIARDTDRRRAREVVQAQQGKITAIRAFFAFPDREHTFQSWLRRVLEDYFVLDAVTVWKWRKLDGSLHGLRVLDGATIKPLLSIQGDRPFPPDPAYQQYLYGVPRDSFTADELIYAPKNARVHSPFGFSPVEQFLTHINLALRFQRFTTDYFTDGTLPEGVATAPATWTPQQIEEFNKYWDAMLAGDSRMLHKLHFLPEGFKFDVLKPFSFDEGFARWLVSVTCAALDISPQELGFEPEHGSLGGKGVAEEQSTILKRKSIGPLTRWLCDELFNPIIWTEFDAPELQATFTETGDEEAQLQAMQARDFALRNGSLSIDQAVEEDGGTPPGIARLFVVGNTLYGEPDLITLSQHGKAALDGASAAAVAASKPEPATPVTPALPAAAPEQTGEAAVQDGKDETQARTQTTADTTKAVAAFVRFAANHRGSKWRDYVSDALPQPLLADLNRAARGGATGDELRALAGMEGQPAAFVERVDRLRTANRAISSHLAQRVAEQIAHERTG